MRHVRMLGLCLIAMFIVTAVAASGASASKFTPEWGQCVQTESGSGGHYGNAGCTAKVKAYHGQFLGAFEWYPDEVHEAGQGGGLYDREEQPETTTFKLAAFTITCSTFEYSKWEISGPKTTLNASNLHFTDCVPSEAPPSEANECHTSNSPETEITTEEAWLDEEGRTWNGTLTVLEGKNTSHPVVGYVYKTTPSGEPFFEQLNCKGAPVVSMRIGGEEENEAIVTTIQPVNTMSASHTVSIGPLAGKVKGTKPLMVLANGKWEPIGIKTTMPFPITEMACSEAERTAGLCVGQVEELKATP